MEAVEQTLKCPVCVDLFTDPVSLPCGHKFCRTCICIVWNMDGPGDGSGGPLFCPECQIFLPSDFKLETNTDIQQKVQTTSACGDEHLTSLPAAVTCDQCIERSSVAVKSCLSCDASLCSAHTLHHLEKEALRGHTLIDVTEDLLFYKCGEHGEELKLFCQDDQSVVCSLCVLLGAHKSHQIVQLQEACSEFRKTLQAREDRLLETKHSTERAKQDLSSMFSEVSSTAKAYRVRIADKYRQMKTLIEKDEQLIMDILNTEEFYTHKWLKSKTESLECQIRDISDLLSASKTLLHEKNQLKFLQQFKKHRYQARMELGPLSAVERECITLHRMETAEQLTDSLYEAVAQNTRRLWANLRAVQLDPETAHPKLEVSSDMLEVRWSKPVSKDSGNMEENTHTEYSILTRETFSSGCHYWEIAVWEKPYWLIGLAYSPDIKAGKKSSCSFSNKAFCYIYHGNGNYLVCNGCKETVLAVKRKIQKLGIWVDFQRETLSFYDADILKLLHSFTFIFLGPMKLILNPCNDLNEQNRQPLVLFNLKNQT